MKTQKLIQTLIVCFALSLCGVALIAVSTHMFFNKVDTLVAKHTDIESDLVKKKTHYATIQKKIVSFNANKQIWDSLGAKQKEINGIPFDEAGQILQKLRDNYHIIDLKVNLSKPIDIPLREFRGDFIGSIKSNVDLEFGAMTEGDVIAFVSGIEELFSGHIVIVNFNLERVATLNNSILLKISNGIFEPLFKCQLKFIWYGFKKITPNNQVVEVDDKK